jgi:hypothetical protein
LSLIIAAPLKAERPGFKPNYTIFAGFFGLISNRYNIWVYRRLDVRK